jgi:signal transduction histidine kinase
MSRLNPLLWPKPPVIWRYPVAILSVAAALIMSRWPVLHLQDAPVSLFLCAVILSAWFGGVWPGLLATALSGLAFDYYFLPPIYSLGANTGELPRLGIFVVSGLFVGLLSATQRSATESLRRARDDLKGTVQDLQMTNEAMHAESRERQYAEDQLRRSEAYLAEAQRLTHTGSWAFNVVTETLIHSSEEHSRLFGFDPQLGIPSFEKLTQRIHPEDRARALQAFENPIRARKDFDAHFRILHPDGTTKYVYGTGHPVFNASGEVGEFVGIVMDVTERKRAEEERERLREAQAELAHINRVTTMGELTASLAHEVNQPIAAAVTNANSCIHWLAGDVPNLDKARAAAMRIVKDGTRAAEIITRIRLLFQKGAPQWQLVDVNEIIGEMVLLLRGEVTRYSISVRTELAAELPQVMGDRVQLQQVMMNLITNSIDALKAVDGTRELAIQSRSENERILVSITDTGVGLPPQQTDEIFNAFFTTKPNGTGMGLRICRSIVESHGGRLWAGNNSSRGAIFFFTLPAKSGARE